MFGLFDVKEVRAKIEAEERVQEILRKQAAESTELRKKEFDGIRSICLDCKHVFYQKYIPNPETPDPLDLICRKKMELRSFADRVGWADIYECNADKWNRKVLECSDFESRK